MGIVLDKKVACTAEKSTIFLRVYAPSFCIEVTCPTFCCKSDDLIHLVVPKSRYLLCFTYQSFHAIELIIGRHVSVKRLPFSKFFIQTRIWQDIPLLLYLCFSNTIYFPDDFDMRISRCVIVRHSRCCSAWRKRMKLSKTENKDIAKLLLLKPFRTPNII